MLIYLALFAAKDAVRGQSERPLGKVRVPVTRAYTGWNAAEYPAATDHAANSYIAAGSHHLAHQVLCTSTLSLKSLSNFHLQLLSTKRISHMKDT